MREILSAARHRLDLCICRVSGCSSARRADASGLHLWGGIGWIVAIAIVVVLGDRRGLLRTARDLEVLRPSRLNVGQKVNALLNAAFALLFLASGLLLWFGERDTTFRFTSTVLLHDILMYAALTLLVGHLYLALIHPATRHSLRGITRGTVREDWAERHYSPLSPPALPTDFDRQGRGREPVMRAGAERHVDASQRQSRCA